MDSRSLRAIPGFFSAFSACLLLLSSTGSAQDAPTLSLNECVRIVLEHSPDLLVVKLDSSRALLEARQVTAEFFPRFHFTFANVAETAPSIFATEVQGGSELISERYLSYSTSITELLPSSTEIFTRFSTERADTSSQDALLAPNYLSKLEFGGSQKLLKGFDWFGTRLGDSWARYKVAARKTERSKQQVQEDLGRILKEVEGAYWDWVAARRIHDARREALSLTQEELDVAQKRVNAGMTVASEIYQFQERLASRRADLLTAEREETQARDALLSQMGIPEPAKVGLSDHFLPSDALTFTPVLTSREEVTHRVLSGNFSLQARREELEAARLDQLRNRSSVLPQLDLSGSFYLLGGNTATIVGSEGSYAQDLDELVNTRSKGWNVSAELSVPLGPNPDRMIDRLSRLEYRRAQANLEREQNRIVLQALKAVTWTELGKSLIETTQEVTGLAEKKVEFERKKFESGMTTGFSMLQFQEDLTDARVREVEALLEFTKARQELEHLLGETLAKFQVQVSRDEDEWGFSRRNP